MLFNDKLYLHGIFLKIPVFIVKNDKRQILESKLSSEFSLDSY